MHSEQLGNWERKAAENAKAYRRFLEKADRRQVLPRLPDLH